MADLVGAEGIEVLLSRSANPQEEAEGREEITGLGALEGIEGVEKSSAFEVPKIDAFGDGEEGVIDPVEGEVAKEEQGFL